MGFNQHDFDVVDTSVSVACLGLENHVDQVFLTVCECTVLIEFRRAWCYRDHRHEQLTIRSITLSDQLFYPMITITVSTTLVP